MTEADLVSYQPRKDETLLQIFELYRAKYVTLEEAKILMQKYTGAASHFTLWRRLHLNSQPA